MFRFTKQLLIVLLSFSRSLATKCVTLSNESCLSRTNLINLNPIELDYYSFVIS